MSKPLWPAVSGAVARDQALEVIANNLANVNTAGFKRDDISFKEYLSKNEKMDDLTQEIPRSPIKDKDLYPLDGRDQSFVVVDGTHTQFKPGGLKVTDNPLDFALEGPGFFEISTPQGIRYTKAGGFKVSGEGRLVTRDGFAVLGKGEGADPAGRYLNLAGREGIPHVNDAGELFIGNDKVGQLSVVEFGDNKTIRKIGSLNYENKNEVANPPQAAQKTWVRQGMIENSNVNPVEEISNMIRSNRMFEEDLKAMKTVNEMMAKEVNDVPKM